jgi:hypothetical protein
VTIVSGGSLTASCGLTNNRTVGNLGTLTMGGDVFVQRGTVSGNPVILANGSTLDPDLLASAGSFSHPR